MRHPRRHRAHAARVAAVATTVVLACYALFAFGLSVFVVHHLTSEVDARLRTRLESVRSPTLTSLVPEPAADGDGDVDDAPTFVWVQHQGEVTPLTSGAPTLPSADIGPDPVTVTIGETSFRLDSTRVGAAWAIAGQSVGSISRVSSTLLLPEVAGGLLLALVTFAGALIVGLRASAPLELVRRRQEEFTADASHELRTPLSVLEAEVDLALRRPRTPEEYQAILRRVSQEGHRLRRIVDDLLWLARVDDGAQVLGDGAPTDVARAAGLAVGRFAPVAAQQEVDLAFESEGSGPASVQIPADWLDRLLGVLLDNAVKYAGSGGNVLVQVSSTPAKVTLLVDDSGPGIPPEERDVIFDRFRRATTEASGTGLGLAIADSVVRESGGAWTVAEAPLGGTRMQVEWRNAVPPLSRSRDRTPATRSSV